MKGLKRRRAKAGSGGVCVGLHHLPDLFELPTRLTLRPLRLSGSHPAAISLNIVRELADYAGIRAEGNKQTTPFHGVVRNRQDVFSKNLRQVLTIPPPPGYHARSGD